MDEISNLELGKKLKISKPKKIIKIKLKLSKFIFQYAFFMFIFLFSFSCVAPPKYSDGLLENIPAVVNDDDYFSLSIHGNDFMDSLNWELDLNMSEYDVLLTTLIVKELNVSPSDSSILTMIVDLGDTIFNANILNDMVFTSRDSIKFIGFPTEISFYGDNFTGRLEYQLIKNPDN